MGAKVVRTSGDPAVVAQRLNRSALVDYAEPNFILKASATPNDPLFSQLYGLNNTGQTGGRADADIDAPEGWDAAGLGGVVVDGECTDDSLHGTHVAGTIAAKANNATGVAGSIRAPGSSSARPCAEASASPPTSPTASTGRTPTAPR